MSNERLVNESTELAALGVLSIFRERIAPEEWEEMRAKVWKALRNHFVYHESQAVRIAPRLHPRGGKN